MGRQTQSLLHDQFPAEFNALRDNAERVAQDQPTREPFPWTILLTTAGLLRWRSVRTVPESEPTRGVYLTTTTRVLFGSPRLGVEWFPYTKTGEVRDDEQVPAPLTPDEIEARDDLDFYLDGQQRKRDQESHYARFWVPRLRKLGLVMCRLPGLPTYDGKPCTCVTCRRPAASSK